MNRYAIFFIFLCFNIFSLHAQEGNQTWTKPHPLSTDFNSKAFFGNQKSANQAYFGMSTLPAYSFASSWQLGVVGKLPRFNAAFGLHMNGFYIGPYHERVAGLFIKREFTKHVAAWLRPTWSQFGVSGYGNSNSIGGEVGIQYFMDGWAMAVSLEKSSLQKDNPSSLVFAWSYCLTENYSINLFVNSQKLHPLQYAAEFSYSKYKHQQLILGLASSIHPYLRYQYQRKKCHLLFSLHYSPVWGLSPDNAYGYAW